MKKQFYSNLIKAFIVLIVSCSMFLKTNGQAGIMNNTGTTQLSCAVSAINVTAFGGINYSWSNGLGTAANAIITAAGTYTVTITDMNGNSSESGITITDHPNGPSAPVEISGPTNLCNYIGSGDQLVYTATAVPGATRYDWTVPPTVNIISGQGTNILTITINSGFESSVNKQLRIKAVANCGASEFTIKYLVVQAPGSIQAINGPADVCPYLGNATEATYSIGDIAGAASYQWTVPAGATITQNNGTNIKVSFSNGFVTSAISVYAINDCGVSNTRSITVNRTLPSKPAMISGNPNGCLFLPSIGHLSGTPATYSVAKTAGASYNWTLPYGVNMALHGSSATADYIKVNFVDGYGGGDISVTATNGCGTSTEKTLTLVSYNPATPSTIVSEFIQACPERLYRYSITGMPSNAISAQWHVPASGTIVSGQGTSSIVVSYPGYTTGIVSVAGNNGCGNGPARSLNVFIPQCQPEKNAGGKAGNNNSAVQRNLILQNQSMEVSISPNPSTTDFKLQVLTAGREMISFKLMDAQGKLVSIREIQPYQTIHLGAGLKTGIYIATITQAGQVKTTRLIKL